MTGEGKGNKLMKRIPLLGTENDQSRANISVQVKQKINNSIFTNPKGK